MNLDVDTSFVTRSLALGGVLLAAGFALQVVAYTVLEDWSFGGNSTYYFLLGSFSNLLTWVGALAALPGLVALGVAAARSRQ